MVKDEPQEELFVIEQGLVLCDARVRHSTDPIGVEILTGGLTWRYSAVTLTCTVCQGIEYRSSVKTETCEGSQMKR